jgi:hypothetical protein
VIDFFAKVKNLSNEEACREILRRAGADPKPVSEKIHTREKGKPEPLELPALVPYNDKLGRYAASKRGLDVTAVEFGALWLKTVVFGEVKEQRCWILYDASRRCAEARRIDRDPFPAIGNSPSAKAMP